MACPYFFPTDKSDNILWAFPQRLPLGAGFCGRCMAQAEQMIPSEIELKEFCNLGYARGCGKIPADRRADAVRFSVANDARKRIRLHYSLEQDHAPVEHGVLEYDCDARSWQLAHQDACIQRLAECYLETYLERRRIG